MVPKHEIRKAVEKYKKLGKPKDHLVEVTFSELTDEQLSIVTFGVHQDLKGFMSAQDVAAALWNLKLLKDQQEESMDDQDEIVETHTVAIIKMPKSIERKNKSNKK